VKKLSMVKEEGAHINLSEEKDSKETPEKP